MGTASASLSQFGPAISELVLMSAMCRACNSQLTIRIMLLIGNIYRLETYSMVFIWIIMPIKLNKTSISRYRL